MRPVFGVHIILTLLCDFVFIIIHSKINSKRFTVILQFSHVFYENGSNGAERTPKKRKSFAFSRTIRYT